MRQLILMRHAKAQKLRDNEIDSERALTPRGEEQAYRMGQWLWHHGHRPTHIVCSSAVRARTTLDQVILAFNKGGNRNAQKSQEQIPRQKIVWEPEIYQARADALHGFAKTWIGKSETVLLIGHNPALDGLLLRLTGSNNSSASVDLHLTPGALAIFRCARPDLRITTLFAFLHPDALGEGEHAMQNS